MITGSSKVRIMDLMKYLKKNWYTKNQYIATRLSLGIMIEIHIHIKIKNKTLKPRNNKNFKNNLDKLIKY